MKRFFVDDHSALSCRYPNLPCRAGMVRFLMAYAFFQEYL